jgi:hypothetical protein
VAAVLPAGRTTLSAHETSAFSRLTTAAKRVFARLRIAERIAAPVARLATGLRGSALAGRDLHPLDDEQDLVKLSLA